LQVAPFDLYRVDLTVFWGGRFGSKLRTAHFGTLRATNPDPTGTGQAGGLPAPRFGGGQR
jgi:general secretion pathway protein I